MRNTFLFKTDTPPYYFSNEAVEYTRVEGRWSRKQTDGRQMGIGGAYKAMYGNTLMEQQQDERTNHRSKLKQIIKDEACVRVRGTNM